MLSILKNDAVRAPRVTGCTRCTLEAGYRIRSPAGSLIDWLPNVVLDDQLAAVVVAGIGQEQRRGQIGAHVEPRAGTVRTALSTWLPNAFAAPS
jgi:hypothetical protein